MNIAEIDASKDAKQNYSCQLDCTNKNKKKKERKKK